MIPGDGELTEISKLSPIICPRLSDLYLPPQEGDRVDHPAGVVLSGRQLHGFFEPEHVKNQLEPNP